MIYYFKYNRDGFVTSYCDANSKDPESWINIIHPSVRERLLSSKIGHEEPILIITYKYYRISKEEYDWGLIQ